MYRLCYCLPHQGRGSDRAVVTRALYHLNDGADAPSLFTEHQAPGLDKLHFARCIGFIANFVLQALDIEPVSSVIRTPSREQEATQPIFRIGKRQEGIRHRGRAEKLVPREDVRSPGPGFGALRSCLCRVGAHIGAALLLRHEHAHSDAFLLFRRNIPEVVFLR